MKYEIRILPSTSECVRQFVRICFKQRKIGLNIGRLAVVLVCLFAFSQAATAQEFEDCRAGFEPGPGNVCRQICPPNMPYDGNACKKPDDYLRNSFKADNTAIKFSGPQTPNNKRVEPNLVANCEKAKVEEQIMDYRGQGPRQRCYLNSEKDAAYAACVPGYRSIEGSICTAVCPPGFAEISYFPFSGCAPQTYPQQPKQKAEPTPVPVPVPEPEKSAPDPTPTDVNAADANGNNDLHLAVSRNDLPAMNDLLSRGINVNALNNSGETPVTFAVEFDNTPALLTMLEKGGDLNAALDRIISRNREGMFRAVAEKFPIRMTDEMFQRAVNAGGFGIAVLSLKYGVDSNQALGYLVSWSNNVPLSNKVPLIEAALEAGAGADPALRYAMENGIGDLAVKIIIRFNPSREGLDTTVFQAIQNGNMPIFQLALDRGADATRALKLAVARNGKVEMVRATLTKNADPNAGLLPSLERGDDTITEMLLAKGADPNPAMPFAIEKQKVTLVRRLLAANATARDQLVCGLAGKTGNIEIIDMLIAAGGYAISMAGGAIENRNYQVTKYLLDKGADATFDDFIDTAARNGDLPIVNLLLERGADPTKGMWGAVNAGNTDVLKALVDKKASAADPRLIALASERGNGAVAALLLFAGANAQNGIRQAVFARSAEITTLLINHGAKVSEPVYILFASKAGEAELAGALLAGGAPKDAMDETGQPLIIIGALTWNPNLVNVLLRNGVDPNAKNRAGDTALHIVANDEASKGYPKFKKMKKARLPIVQALVNGGADVNATNAKGETVLKSLGGGDDDVKKIIIAAGAVKKIGEQ